MKIRAYSEAGIDVIARQLQQVSVNGERVFAPVVSTDTMGKHHVIYLDCGLGVQVLEFKKAQEEAEVKP